MRILLVEDDVAVARVLARMLTAAGHVVERAENGALALKILEVGSRFEVLVTDLFMPEKEGRETIRDVHRRFPRMRIVAVSGGLNGLDAGQWTRLALVLGATAALTKPVVREALLAAVAGGDASMG